MIKSRKERTRYDDVDVDIDVDFTTRWAGSFLSSEVCMGGLELVNLGWAGLMGLDGTVLCWHWAKSA